MRAIVPVRTALHVVRRNMRDHLSLVILSTTGRLSPHSTLATLDGTWKAGETFLSPEAAIEAAHSYVERQLGVDRLGPRWLAFPVGMASKFPLSVPDLDWARGPLPRSATERQMAQAMIAHAAVTGGPDGKD